MIITDGNSFPSLTGPFITVGVFDGVHLGHRALLDQLVLKASQAGRMSVVITFDPHPKLVLGGSKNNLAFLSTPEEKKELLGKSGIDHLVIIPFTRELASMEGRQFISEILVDRMGAGFLLVGYDNHFGKGRDTGFESISRHAARYGLETEQVKGLSGPDGVISSTTIRNALLDGRLDVANSCLGYSYSLTGTVVPGNRLGNSLGFPTANLKPPLYKLVPADGVYTVEVNIDEKTYGGMLSIGMNPTVNNDRNKKTVEVHIFDFGGDLYGQAVTVVFRYRLRDERKFDNLEQLAAQMRLDKIESLRLLT
jgi:riboflavin kinase/FMN adenylyltransferase